MKQSNVVKCLALVCALSMPLAAFAASPGGAGAGGAAGTGAAGTGGASTGAPGAGTAGTGRHGQAQAQATRPIRRQLPSPCSRCHPTSPPASSRICKELYEQGVNKRAARWRPLLFAAVQ